MASKMKTYVVTYHMTASAAVRAQKAMKKNPEAGAKVMAAWGEWAQRCGKQLVQMGAPLGKSVKINTDGQSASKRNITGYSIVQAPTMAGAKKLMKNHPHLASAPSGCDIEIHESMPM